MYPGSKWARMKRPALDEKSRPVVLKNPSVCRTGFYFRVSAGRCVVYLHHRLMVAKAGRKC